MNRVIDGRGKEEERVMKAKIARREEDEEKGTEARDFIKLSSSCACMSILIGANASLAFADVALIFIPSFSQFTPAPHFQN